MADANPKRVLTEEHKAKMKLGRDIAKARRDAENSEQTIQLEDWRHNFGDGSKLYKLLYYDGASYVYDHKSHNYLGAFIVNTNSLDSSVPLPLDD